MKLNQILFRARKLLNDLEKQDNIFTYDDLGNVWINGELQSNLNLKDCLSETIYHNKAIRVNNFEKWMDLLKRLKLEAYVTNSVYKTQEKPFIPEAWYFLGELGE